MKVFILLCSIVSAYLIAPNSTDVYAQSLPSASSGTVFDLRDFGAIGDGQADDGPAIQSALDAIADAGGGTLFVPAGRYAIVTPVSKDFAGLASAVVISGVVSPTPVPPRTSPGSILTKGLDLVSEFVPQTGAAQMALSLKGLDSLVINDIAFIGTPGINTDALVTVQISETKSATISHCEFYGLSTLAAGGAIVHAIRTNLTIEKTKFLGCTGNSGIFAPVVENLEWIGITITDSIFTDYGQRPELYGKLNLAAPLAWINIGNAAAKTPASPRREVVIRNIFLDEGGYNGIISSPYRYSPPTSTIDLVDISGLFMNVSNLSASGNYLDGVENLLIEQAHYGWSHNAHTAVNMFRVGTAVLDQLECVDGADTILAESATHNLTVINSQYTSLDSQAQNTITLVTAPEDDPVTYVRTRYNEVLGHEPDAAAHFYWTDVLLDCGEDSQCLEQKRALLTDYLSSNPSARFSIIGTLKNEDEVALSGAQVTLSGSQPVTAITDVNGKYFFSDLPTGGEYTLTASRANSTFSTPTRTITTPNGDQVLDFDATMNRHLISGVVRDSNDLALAGVTVDLTGSQLETATTGASGSYSFNVAAEGNYTVTVSKPHYDFALPTATFNDLVADQNMNFAGVLRVYAISGRVKKSDNSGMSGVAVTLSGSSSGMMTTGADGSYVFASLPEGGDYTVTPTIIDFAFTPAATNYQDLDSNKTADFTASIINYTLSGVVTNEGVGMAGVTVSLGGSMTGSRVTDSAGSYSFTVNSGGSYTLVPTQTGRQFDPASATVNQLRSNQIVNFARLKTVVEFGAATYNVVEGAGSFTINVVRSGDISEAASVFYSAANGSANQRSDLSPILGSLDFAPGESSKTITIFVTDDGYLETTESLTLTLSDVSGAVIGANASAIVSITDNDANQSPVNPIDNAQFFVRQHYRDFLNREPDAEGLAFWSDQITSCGTDAVCVADRRINVSAAFFLSIEFQETGFLVERLYKASFAQLPEHREEFLLDSREIGNGIVVGSTGWKEALDANKTRFIRSFVERTPFTEMYPLSMTPADFVNALNTKAGSPLSSSETAAAISDFGNAQSSSDFSVRALVLTRIVESPVLRERELSPAFVVMQYFGYLQRHPAELPDSNLDGYNYWLGKLNEFGGDFRRAEMVKAFLLSSEYRNRFGN